MLKCTLARPLQRLLLSAFRGQLFSIQQTHLLSTWVICPGCYTLTQKYVCPLKANRIIYCRYLTGDKKSEPCNTPVLDKATDKIVPPIASLSSASKDESATKQDTTQAKAPDAPQEADKFNTIFKVTAAHKPAPKERRITDHSKPYTANIFITPLRAIDEYLLTQKDLERLPKTKRRSPYPELDDITVYLRKDVEEKALQKWGSMDKLIKERNKLYSADSRFSEEPVVYTPNSKKDDEPKAVFSTGSGRVVMYAIVVNALNAGFKLIAWLYSGSHSMFSEFIHSLADTINQCFLAFGIHQSYKKADLRHPYGWSSFRNISSLISGVAIFCLGSGVSLYHGVMGLVEPEPIQNIFWATAILFGSLVSEGASFFVALIEVKKSSKEKGIPFLKYIWANHDPMTNVVLLEDMAAVVGVMLAGSCMGLSYYMVSGIPDAMGSLFIATLLGGVASFIIYANTESLVGRSIPPEKKQQIMKELEADRVVRALHDVKATDMGNTHVRFKAEVDFDGRELTRLYLESQDMDRMLKEMQSMQSVEQVETFMIKHGEAIVDTLGAEVDRIEKDLKARHPELRHVDLEQL